MITADVARAAQAAARDAIAAGDLRLPRGAAHPLYLLPTFGGHEGLPPGTYASALPLRLAGPAGRSAPDVAGCLADRLGRLPWVAAAQVTGPGYLQVTVTPEALAGLASRVVAAGAACAESDALAGRHVAARASEGWQHAGSWAEAAALIAVEVTGRCARSAGARVTFEAPRRLPRTVTAPETVTPAGAGTADAGGAGTGTADSGSPAALAAFAGDDAVRYAVCAAHSAAAMPGAARAAVRHHVRNPGYAVRYAHAHAAATLRHAKSLGFVHVRAGDAGPPGAAGREARLLGHPGQRVLLRALSWLPERVAATARRGQPAVLARYLGELASAYHDAVEACPVLPYAGGPRDPAARCARLRLTAAATTALGVGLCLLGVGELGTGQPGAGGASAPDRKGNST